MAGLFGGGMKTPQAQEQPAVGALNVSTSAYGLVRPLVWGRARLPVNMLWYGDFTATAHQSGGGQQGGKGGDGGGGGGSTSYTYSASMAMGVCEGPITGIGTVWEAKNETTVAAMGGTVIVGNDGQAPWTYLSSNHPAEAVSFSGLAYIGLPNYQLGDSPNTPNISAEVKTPSEFSAEIFDALPSVVVSEFLERAAFPSAKVGGLSAYGTYCQAMGIFISPALIEQAAANATLQDWLHATNSEAVWSSGVLAIVPYGDTEVTGNGVTYTPDLTPQYDLGDDDFFPEEGEDPVICTRPDSADAYNRYSVEFKDRSNAYNVATATVDDQAAIDQFGLRATPVVKAHFISDMETAEFVARVFMARGLYVRAQYEFRLSWKHCRLDAMDLVTLTDSGLGLDRELVRIIEIEWPEDDGPATVKAEEVPGAIAAPARYVTQATNSYAANFNADPDDANPPVIFEPPDVLATTGLEVWVAASGGPIWGGAEVWLSTTGDNYARVGIIAAPSRQGVLSATLPVGAATDNTNTLSVDMSMSRGVLNSGSAADAVALNSLCYVGGELLAYTTATLTGAHAYGLTGLVRGAYGTTIATHDAGAQFARYDAGAAFKYPFLPADIGSTVHIKLLSFNVWGAATQSLADVDPITYRITGSALASPLPNVTSLSVGYVGGISQMSWAGVTDFRTVDYEIRQGASASTAQVIGRTPNTFVPTYGDGTYWIAAHYTVPNGGDVYSSEWAEVIVTGSQLTSNVIAGFDESATGWSGALSDTRVVAGNVEIAASGNILASADVLNITDVLNYGGFAPSGIYTVPAGHRINVGRVATCNIIAKVAANGRSANDNILAVADVLNLADVLGALYGPSVSATPQIRRSQDGATWGAWQDWFPAAYTAMAFDFRVMLESSDPDVVPVLTAFSFDVDVPDRTDFFRLDVAAGGTSVLYADGLQGNPAANFNGGPKGAEVPHIQASIVSGAQQGDDIVITADSNGGFTIQVKNGGVGVSGRTVNVNPQGY
jgi:hypothetical protein